MQSVLKWILGAAIVSTALHFTHNFVRVEDYPSSGPITDTVVQVAIVVSWPLFTALALYAYRLYAAGRLHAAHIALAVYSFFPMTTLGHFTSGTPDAPAFWFATIFTEIGRASCRERGVDRGGRR